MQEEKRTAGESVPVKTEASDVGVSKTVRRYSPRLLKYGHKDNADVAEKQRILEALTPCRISPLNSSSLVTSFFREDSIGNLVQGCEANGTSESKEEDAKVKIKESSQLNVENVSALKISEQSFPDRNINDRENSRTSDQRKEMTDAADKTGRVIHTVLGSCKIGCSEADDPYEMMDIGTVDQMDQESQIKGEDSLDTICSTASSNMGKVQLVVGRTAKY